MRSFYLSLTGAVMMSLCFTGHLAMKSLHEATLRQCYLHAWPADKAEAHIKFCADYVKRNG